jgi:hypothetical protein
MAEEFVVGLVVVGVVIGIVLVWKGWAMPRK